MKKFVLLFLLGLCIGCEKDKIFPVFDENSYPTEEERFMAQFTQYSSELIIGIGGWAGGCLGSYQFHSHGIRFREGEAYENKYFYRIETNMLRFHACDTFYTSDWESLGKYYRYAFDENKSFIYSSLYDNSPEMIFDFNCNVGDTLLLNQDKLARMKVTAVGEQIIDGISFPFVKGKIVSFSRTGTFNSNDDAITPSSVDLIITPFSPNPFWTGFSLNEYFEMSWSSQDFCVPVTAASISMLGLNCRNAIDQQWFYDYGFLVHY